MSDRSSKETPASPPRRRFVRDAALGLAAAAAAGGAAASGAHVAHATGLAPVPSARGGHADGEHWPDHARLVLSISMQFEAGGEPERGADSPFPDNLPAGLPDLPARTWFQYGYREGIPRLLDLWDKHGLKVTSHMVGAAVLKSPELAREIVRRGHEAAAHGMDWRSQADMSREQETRFVRDGMDAVERITGQRPRGYNCNWLRRSPHTLSVLRELGFVYHIDDLSRDEPFIVPVDGGDFVVVPYTLHCNDIVLIEGRHFSSRQFFEQLKDEFDQLYAEGATRRRVMSISTHDRIGGRPAVVRALDEFLSYALAQPGVVGARKDALARWTLADRSSRREPVAT